MSQLPCDDLKALLVLNRMAQDRRPLLPFLREGMRPTELWARIREENFLGKSELLKQLDGVFDPGEEMEKASRLGIRFMALTDPDYPALLREIADPPIVLYARGDFSPSDSAMVAVVGTRHPNVYGAEQTRRFAEGLARRGLTVISGFAVGVDRLAHQAALSVPYGRTFAVMGCGLDIDYPQGSRPLFDQIVERGVVLSEYALGTPPYAENFPRRNRIIAGLSLGVLVVQAHARSGSLITARLAIEEGREVFAVPGPVDAIRSQGTHSLIREGAALVESAEDIIESLAIPLVCHVPRGENQNQNDFLPSELTPEEKQAVSALEKKSLNYDEMASACRLGAGAAASLLMKLELKRLIKKQPNGRFVLSGAQ